MTGGPFAFERIAKQFWTGYENWASKFISSRLRLRIGITVAVFGLFTASFLAYHDKAEQLAKLNASLIARGIEPSNQYETLDQSTIRAIVENLRTTPKTETFVSVVLPNPSAARLAKQLSAAFVEAGFSSSVTIGWLTEDNDRGIKMLVHNAKHPSPQAQLYIDALRKSGLNFEVDDITDEEAFKSFVFSVFIGPRP